MPPRINLPAVLPTEAKPASPRIPLVPERSNFLEGDAPGGRQGRSLPGPRPGGHRQRCPEYRRGLGAVDLRRAALEPLGQSLRPRPDGLPAAHAGSGRGSPGGHRRPRQALQAGPPGSRDDVGHRGQAALRPPGDLQAACGQGTGLLGDGPGHRRGQGPRRPEELDAVPDPAAGDRTAGGDPQRHPAGDPRPGPDERLLHHRLPGLGGDRSLRGTLSRPTGSSTI